MALTFHLFFLVSVTVAFAIQKSTTLQSKHSNPKTWCDGHQGQWDRVLQRAHRSRNLCTHNKSVAELYFLGPAKTASTSLAVDLREAGVECAGASKEWNFWSAFHVKDDDDDFSQIQARFLDAMPDCTFDHRRVIGDFAPRKFLDSSVIPPLLKHLYGDLHHRIKFIVMPREPMSFVQSYYYYTRKARNIKPGPTDFGDEVQQFLTKVEMDADAGVLAMSRITTYQNTEYGESNFHVETLANAARMGSQFKGWLSAFSAKQFIVIPYRLYFEEGKQVCEIVSKAINFVMDCKSNVMHAVNSVHPRLDEDLSPELYMKFQTHFASEALLLSGSLMDGYAKGMVLPLYQNESSVADWLSKYW